MTTEASTGARAAAGAVGMDPQTRAQLLRAARGVHQAPPGDVPMGIRYRTSAVPARPAPADRRPPWTTAAPTGVLQETAETAPRPARTTARATAAAPQRPTSTPAPAPADTAGPDPAPGPATRPIARNPVASAVRQPAPAPRGAEPTRGTGPTRSAEPPRVLGSYDAFACEACGSRYSQPATDHECGPLTPVTVTITTKTAGGRA